MTTPDDITTLGPNQVFVFGSNRAGEHYAGAAYAAWVRFGAGMGVGEGLVGQSYAFPTLASSEGDLRKSAMALQRTAEALPAVTFYLTKVGCGIAGFDEDYMKQFFKDMPDNVIKPKGW